MKVSEPKPTKDKIDKKLFRDIKARELQDYQVKRDKLDPTNFSQVGQWHHLDALCNYINCEISLIDNGVYDLKERV